MHMHVVRAAALAAVLCLLPATAVQAGGTVHEIMQSGVSWSPADIQASPGDIIRWVWNTGGHTVTSGADCTHDELWFDETLNQTNPVVEWQVPEDFAAGILNFHCRPHCALFGMEGTIDVLPLAGCPEDLDGTGAVDFGDLLNVLSNWGPCPGCPADLDGDGTVAFADLLQVLSNWGPC